MAFLHLLFDRPQRVTAFMLHWHSRQPGKGKSLQSVWRAYVQAMLYAPLNVCVSPSGVWPFGNDKPSRRAFFIAFEWMDRIQPGKESPEKNGSEGGASK